MVLRDTLATEFVSTGSYSPAPTSVTPGPPIVLEWVFPTLDPGVLNVSFDATLATPLNNGTTIANTATLDSDETVAAASNLTTQTVSSAPVFTASTKTAVDQNGGDLEPG